MIIISTNENLSREIISLLLAERYLCFKPNIYIDIDIHSITDK